MYRSIFLTCMVLLLGLFLTNTTQAQDPNLVGWWKFDEGSGDIAYDESSNSYDGTINGNPEWASGITGQALEFDGIDDFVIVTRMVETDFTLMAWIKTDQPGDVIEGDYPATGGDGLFFAGVLGGATNNDFILALVDTQLIFGVGDDSAGPTNQSVVTGDWIHIALTRTAETGDVSIFIDGILDLTATLENTNPLTQNPSITFGANTIHLHYYAGLMDDVRIYDRALIPEEIRTIVSDVVSYSAAPTPTDGATYVPKNVLLSWKPGMFAHKHDVYFGTVIEDVSNASRVNPLSVLASEGQDANTYDPGPLEFGQTYFWRVDEVNAPPELTIFQGDVWRFIVEPVLYPIPGENITATASSQFSDDQTPQNTIDGSGMDINRLHSKSTSAMWLSASSEPGSAWIQYDFNKIYKLHEMLVWNYNGVLFLPGYGLKDVTVEYSTDGNTWTALEDVPEFAKATGADGYAANTTVDFGGIVVKSVRITAHSNWGTSLFDMYGLSEVLFLAMPFDARVPSPRNGARNIALDTTLSWIAGREAAEHKVYISKDKQGVTEGTTAAVTVSQTSYGPLSLELATPYYWRIDEVNNVEATPLWQGNLWSFITTEYLFVDDFESYNDIESGQDGSKLVYETWIDGYANPSTNGSTMGYFEGSALENEIVHRGEKSVPLFYDNTTASISEVTVSTDILDIGRDWAALSPEVLSLWFYGDPNNATTERMYVKLNGSKVVYDGDPNNLIQETWQQWSIDLSAFGINLSNVTEMTIGFERTETTGGIGMVFIDDIQLYAPLNDQAILEQ